MTRRYGFALTLLGLLAAAAPTTSLALITFRGTYGGADNDYGYSVRQTADGGYIVAGHTLSFGAGGADVYLVKTDSSGAQIWSRTFGGTDNDYGWSVRQTADGGYIIAGITYSFGRADGDLYLIKTDPSGTMQWSRTYGGSGSDHGCDVEPTADRGFILVGKYGKATGYDDVFLVRTDSLGELKWTRTYGGDSSECGWAVRADGDGGYVIAGNTSSYGAGGWDAYMLRTNAVGDTLWTRTQGGADLDGVFSVQPAADGGFVFAGETQSFGAGKRDVYLIRTDSSGNVLWTRTFGGNNHDDASSIQPTSDGAYIVAGSTQTYGAGDVDVYLVKVNSSGDSLWTRTFGGRYWEIGKSVQPTSDGGYVIAGHTESFGAGLIDMYLIKTDSLGRADAVTEPTAVSARVAALSVTCRPNPFRSSTTLKLGGSRLEHSTARIRIYNVEGRAVRTLFARLPAAASLTWDGKDDSRHLLPAGAYFVSCDVAGERATVRTVLQR